MSRARRRTLALTVGIIAALAAAVGASCGGERRGPAAGDATDPAAAGAVDPASAAAAPAPADDRAAAPCPDPVLHHEDGAARGWICRDEAAARGLTIVDLSERWAPSSFGAPGGPVAAYRDTYLMLAAEQDPDGRELPPEERLVEMYGIAPAPSVVLRRLDDEPRHACHDAVDRTPLAAIRGTLRQVPSPQADAALRRRRAYEAWLERERKKLGAADLAALAEVPRLRTSVRAWQRLAAEEAAVRAAQQHLACDGLFEPRRVDGRLSWVTGDAIDFFQRANFLLPHRDLDADTREAMLAGSRELAFRAALRLLRERVVDATGLIEDGSAGAGPVPVLGRMLEPEVMRHAKGHAPLPHAAPDRIGPATEAAARHLGWTTPEAARAWLAAHHGRQLEVALALPPPPAYHARHMELRAVLDRGDVWYDPTPRPRSPRRRPALVLYAKHGHVDVPLVRWPSTIGGWADEVMPGGWIKKKWKESDVGPRVWRELYVAPTWQPPDTTPDAELVRNLYNGRYRLKREVFGPGPRSAYGMAMLIHHRPFRSGKGQVTWGDNGIRVHGSSSVTSVIRGSSHGCHRLLNHLAVRLAGFLVRHRDHVVHGDQRSGYRRVVRHKGEAYPVRLDGRGFLYELTPPVPVEVTKGRIMTARQKPYR